MNQFNLPDNEKLAAKVIDAQSKEVATRLQQGWLGRFWGSTNAPRNIAGVIVCIFSALFVYIVVSSIGDQGFSPKDALASVSSLITLLLGYLFGRASASKE